MQQEGDSTDNSAKIPAASTITPFPSPDVPNWSLRQLISSRGEFTDVFSCVKSSPLPSSTQLCWSPPLPLTPSSVSGDEETEDAAVTESQVYLARLALQYEDLLDRYESCLSRLEEATEEAEVLRLENANLQMANAELARSLSFLSTYGKPGGTGDGLMGTSVGLPSNLVDEFSRLHFDADSSLPESNLTGNADFDLENLLQNKAPFQEFRSALPKSISIRSSGYTKLAASTRNSRFRVSSPLMLRSPQRVDAPVEEEGEGTITEEKGSTTLDLEVCAQGMFKTELCNKWQETGACPYGERCQFAHGISELRPVIRHPRYKTQVCRMVLAGSSCPYGHRCHFRHAVTPQDY